MSYDKPIVEPPDLDTDKDPDEIPIRDRRLVTQPYDLVVEALIAQIKGGTIFLRPLSERPNFQRRYVWADDLASRLIESILLNVPIPPCYLSQNDNFELDVIDGQQRLFSIYRFIDNQFELSNLEVLTELNEQRFFQLPSRLQRQMLTHTLRCILITNESHPEIKFDVFQRLNTNTVPLNSQELRNCIFRGSLNDLLHDVVEDQRWLNILGKKSVDKRMRDEELALRFFAFWIHGVGSYRTPQKHWLNETARHGMNYSAGETSELRGHWDAAISASLALFDPHECFRRTPFSQYRTINRALFDLTMTTGGQIGEQQATKIRKEFRNRYSALLDDVEFADLISRAVDHTKRTKRRFEMWAHKFNDLL